MSDFYFKFKKQLWVCSGEKTFNKRKKMNQLKEEFQIQYGLSFYDGPRQGLVKRFSDEKHFFFECVENYETFERVYVLFDLNISQQKNIKKEIFLFEQFCGTYCRYVDGKRISNTNPEYKYITTSENWHIYCNFINENKIGHNFLNLKKDQIIGFINSKQMFNKRD
jgi:hypothetical protein